MTGWKVTSLSSLVEIKHGFAFKGEYITEEETQNLLLTPGNFAVGGGFQLKRMKFYSGDVPADYILKPGELIVTMTDLSKEADTLGYSSLVPLSQYRMLHNQRIGRVIIKSDAADIGFIHWVMRTPEYRNEILANYTGSTVKHTSPGKILAYRFGLPPLAEQREIAATLGALDDKIELNRRTAATLEEMARALHRSWFVDFDPVRAHAEGRAPAHMDPTTAALFPDSFGEDGLPVGWVISKLTHLTKSISNGGTPKRSIPAYWDGGTIPWLTSGEVRQDLIAYTENFITEKGLKESSAKWIPKGATVIALYGATAGQVSRTSINLTTNQAICSVTAPDSYQHYLFLALKAQVEDLASKAIGSAQQNISKKIVEDIAVLKPPAPIAECFQNRVSTLFLKIDSISEENRTLAAVRDTLLPRLMSGELRVGAAREMVEEVA